MTYYTRFEAHHGGDAAKQERFELLHDYLKAKREDAWVAKAKGIGDDDDHRRDIEAADRWLRELFDDMAAFDAAEDARQRAKLEHWEAIAK